MLTFYTTIDSSSIRSYMPAVPVLIPASSFYDRKRRRWRACNLPSHVEHTAIDPGGFVATFRYGGYPFHLSELITFARRVGPEWMATLDYCCEPEIAANAGIVRRRQFATTLRAWQCWGRYQGEPWAWVPTVQGWEVEDYARHARELRPLVEAMQQHYGDDPRWRVGIGTLCRRASPKMIRRVVATVAEVLGPVPLHLWGVKLDALKSRIALPGHVVSVDSAAWNGLFGSDRDKQRQSGLTQRQYTYLVAHPDYMAKVEAALDAPKQMEIPL